MANEIRLEGAEALLAKLDRLGRLDYAKAGVKAAALYLKGKLGVYPEKNRPTRKSVYGVTWKTKKQRRFFFWALREGFLQVPYRRGSAASGSERFKAKWTLAIEDNGLTAVVGNNVTYGRLLMGNKSEQSIYMRRVGWRPAEEIVDEEREEVLRIMKQSIDDGLAE